MFLLVPVESADEACYLFRQGGNCCQASRIMHYVPQNAERTHRLLLFYKVSNEGNVSELGFQGFLVYSSGRLLL